MRKVTERDLDAQIKSNRERVEEAYDDGIIWLATSPMDRFLRRLVGLGDMARAVRQAAAASLAEYRCTRRHQIRQRERDDGEDL